MIVSRLASPRLIRAATSPIIVAAVLVACSANTPTPPPSADAAASATPRPPAATPPPTPTPAPTPRFTNEPDDELAALIPTEAAGIAIVLAPFDEFALTPGDIAIAFGEIGDRFSSLVLAYVPNPRTSLYAMRVDGAPVLTEELEPHLATAGRYVGIAGLHREPWTADTVAGNVVWTRPEDNATALGTHIYTWSSGELVFLLIGTDDALNRAIIEQLPGEPAPTPSPAPSLSAPAAPSSDPSASPEG
ncbi:MAG TPA: hypothetical protein VI277_00900 [Candidatus Limnocylindria bacterium]